MIPVDLTLADLSDSSGIPARTIRFYIARGLLPGPVKAGRSAAYTPDHLDRLRLILRLQTEGRTLVEIAGLMNDSRPSAPPPVAWWQHTLGGDVTVSVRADAPPWRMKQIRAALDDFAARLHSPAGEETKRKQNEERNIDE